MSDELTLTLRRNSDGAVRSLPWPSSWADDTNTLAYYFYSGNAWTSCNRFWWFNDTRCECHEDMEDEPESCNDSAFTVLHIKDEDGRVLYTELTEGPEAILYKLTYGGVPDWLSH